MLPDNIFISGIIGADDRYDALQMGKKGHNLMGRLGAAYIETQLCEMDKFEASIPGAKSMTIDQLYPLEPIPRVSFCTVYKCGYVNTDENHSDATQHEVRQRPCYPYH